MSNPNFIVWVREGRGRWEENGDGPMTRRDADRVVRELRGLGITRVLPCGVDMVNRVDLRDSASKEAEHQNQHQRENRIFHSKLQARKKS